MSDPEYSIERSEGDYDALEQSTVDMMVHYGVSVPVNPLMLVGHCGSAYAPPLMHIRKNGSRIDPRKAFGVYLAVFVVVGVEVPPTPRRTLRAKGMSKMSLSIERLCHPDGKSLGSLIAGLSGSGKTVATISTLQQAIRSPSFGEFHRFIIIDPKTQTGDYDVLADPIWDIEKAFKSIRKERVTVFYPTVEHIHNDVSSIIDYIFTLADSEPKTSFTFVHDRSLRDKHRLDSLCSSLK